MGQGASSSKPDSSSFKGNGQLLSLASRQEYVPRRLEFAVSESDPIYVAAFAYYHGGKTVNELYNLDKLLRSEEGLKNYKDGGFHSVYRGQLYQKRFLIVKKLGWGHFSTVWLAADLQTFSYDLKPPCEHVAIKFQRGQKQYMDSAVEEIKILQRIDSVSRTMNIPRLHLPVVRIIGHFDVMGTVGKHICTVMDALGGNLFNLIKASPEKRVPISSVKLVARDALRGLDFLHRHCHVIHTDLKPENILTQTNEVLNLLAQGQFHRWKDGGSLYAEDGFQYPAPVVKIADLGNACHAFDRHSDYITTRQYRAPEVLVRSFYGCAADIWSLGCIIFELLTGHYLFDPKPNESARISRDDDHIALIAEILGPATQNLIRSPLGQHYFLPDGRLRRIPDLAQWHLHEILVESYGFGHSDATEIAAFLIPMLHLDPSRRVSAKQHLRHPWLRSVMCELPRSSSDSFVVDFHNAPQSVKNRPSSQSNSLEGSISRLKTLRVSSKNTYPLSDWRYPVATVPARVSQHM